jgi:hypothetical protein
LVSNNPFKAVPKSRAPLRNFVARATKFCTGSMVAV